MAPPDLGEGLVGTLHDALRADIDPRARGHLPVHHEAFAIELVEMTQRCPVRHEIGVGDQHARRVRLGAKHADRLAGLHAQRLVGFERAQRGDHAVEAFPVARGAADAAVDHKLVRLLRHVGIEIVHQHPQRRLRQPAPGGKLRAARRPDEAGIVETGGHRVLLQQAGAWKEGCSTRAHYARKLLRPHRPHRQMSTGIRSRLRMDRPEQAAMTSAAPSAANRGSTTRGNCA